MPPESLSRDRKDLSNETKKRDRSPNRTRPVWTQRETPRRDWSSPRAYYGRGVGGFPSRLPDHGKPGGWHHYPGQSGNGLSPYGYIGKNEYGHGEQGGWHHYNDQYGHGFSSSEKIVDGETRQNSGPRVDSRYIGNSRVNRPFFRQDWKGHPLENGGSTEWSGRPMNLSAQRSVYSRDQFHYNFQPNKIESVSEFGERKRSERGNQHGSFYGKPHKWTRAGSMSARSFGFSHSSFSKSSGLDSAEAKTEVQKSVISFESHSEDAAHRVQSAALSEEMSLRKKPHVRWAEGLAKFERKKVDVPTKLGMVDCSSIEDSSVGFPDLTDKSPRLAIFSESASAAMPSSIPCNSSPGIVEKRSRADNATSNGSGSSNLHSKDHVKESDVDLESLDSASVAKLSSSLIELSESLKFDDPTAEGSSFVRTTAMKRLLAWKGSVTKALEITESEIKSLENELNSLISGSGSYCHFPAMTTSLTGSSDVQTHEVQVGSDSISQLAGLQLVSSGNVIKEQDTDMEEIPDPLRGDGADSPGVMTWKFIGLLSSSKNDALFNRVQDSVGSADIDANTSEDLEQEVTVYGCKSRVLTNEHGPTEIKLVDLITASNKELADEAFTVFDKVLPSVGCTVDNSRTSIFSNCPNNTVMKEKFAARKRFLKFKERVLTLKVMVFRHFWKEDTQLFYANKPRKTSQRKSKSSSQTLCLNNQMRRSYAISRLSHGDLSVVLPVEVINFTRKLLCDSPFKLQRSALRMPAMILDKDKIASQFLSNNGLVEDPCAVEKERALINPWTTEEKNIFLDKFGIFGKDFSKIASFLDHKTTADCIEFYYKNHKSDFFGKRNKKPNLAGQGQSQSAHYYLVTSGKQRNQEAGAASLDLLDTASAVPASARDDMQSLKNPKPLVSATLTAQLLKYGHNKHCNFEILEFIYQIRISGPVW